MSRLTNSQMICKVVTLIRLRLHSLGDNGLPAGTFRDTRGEGFTLFLRPGYEEEMHMATQSTKLAAEMSILFS